MSDLQDRLFDELDRIWQQKESHEVDDRTMLILWLMGNIGGAVGW